MFNLIEMGKFPHREFYIFHTDNENIEVMDKSIRRSEKIKRFNEIAGSATSVGENVQELMQIADRNENVSSSINSKNKLDYPVFRLDELDLQLLFNVHQKLIQYYKDNTSHVLAKSSLLKRLEADPIYVHYYDEEYWAKYVRREYEQKKEN